MSGESVAMAHLVRLGEILLFYFQLLKTQLVSALWKVCVVSPIVALGEWLEATQESGGGFRSISGVSL